jgi:hypothetical protein
MPQVRCVVVPLFTRNGYCRQLTALGKWNTADASNRYLRISVLNFLFFSHEQHKKLVTLHFFFLTWFFFLSSCRDLTEIKREWNNQNAHLHERALDRSHAFIGEDKDMYWFYRISDMIGYNLYFLHHARDHVLYVYVYVEFDCKMNARSRSLKVWRQRFRIRPDP